MAKPKTCKSCGYEFHIEQEDMKKWKNWLMVCPKCLETFSVMKPETERILQRLQYMYFGSNEKNKRIYIKKIYEMYVDYTQSLIKKHYSNLITSQDFLDEKSREAVHFVIEETFSINEKIQISFGGYVLHKIRQVLFGKPYHETGSVSINYDYDDGNQVQYQDTKDLLNDIEKHQDKKLTAKYTCDLIFGYERECEDKRENFLRLIALNFFLNQGERKVDNFFKTFGRYGKIKYEETIMLLRHELKRVQKESGSRNARNNR